MLVGHLSLFTSSSFYLSSNIGRAWLWDLLFPLYLLSALKGGNPIREIDEAEWQLLRPTPAFSRRAQALWWSKYILNLLHINSIQIYSKSFFSCLFILESMVIHSICAKNNWKALSPPGYFPSLTQLAICLEQETKVPLLFLFVLQTCLFFASQYNFLVKAEEMSRVMYQVPLQSIEAHSLPTDFRGEDWTHVLGVAVVVSGNPITL